MHSRCIKLIYGDHLGQMNHKISEKLVNSQLLPYLPQNKVVIMGNVLYHCMQENTLFRQVCHSVVFPKMVFRGTLGVCKESLLQFKNYNKIETQINAVPDLRIQLSNIKPNRKKNNL
jgi:hypothetical protein